ncbi:hypothetical protein GCM10010129_00630 [Streptomyces fumigatiscleroticus]|nr:hypothetical protein GCM10010129_00630 [Streptomyces fumigatiscleroticus]
MARPLLFLDVDGPLSPYAARPERRPEGYPTIRVPLESATGPDSGWPPLRRGPLRVWLHPGHGPALLALGYELCWATTWMSAANRWIGPVLGLPPLPFVDFGDSLLRERADGAHWKCEALVAYADGRPFAWVDDEQGDADHAHVAARHPAPALLHHVNPRIGLRNDDFTALAGFAASLAGRTGTV